MRFGDQAVVRTAATKPGPYGTTVPDWSAATAVTVPCVVEPVKFTEDPSVGDRLVSRWRIYAPAGTQLTATSRVEWGGLLLEVEGEVGRWRRGRREHHVEALLMRVQEG